MGISRRAKVGIAWALTVGYVLTVVLLYAFLPSWEAPLVDVSLTVVFVVLAGVLFRRWFGAARGNGAWEAIRDERDRWKGFKCGPGGDPPGQPRDDHE